MSADNPEQLHRNAIKELIVSITVDHDTDTLEEVLDIYVDRLDAYYKAQASKDMAEVIGKDSDEKYSNEPYERIIQHETRAENSLRARQRKTAASKGYEIEGE